ncbi:unnamed protein product, partial [Laminaria digitata]
MLGDGEAGTGVNLKGGLLGLHLCDGPSVLGLNKLHLLKEVVLPVLSGNRGLQRLVSEYYDTLEFSCEGGAQPAPPPPPPLSLPAPPPPAQNGGGAPAAAAILPAVEGARSVIGDGAALVVAGGGPARDPAASPIAVSGGGGAVDAKFTAAVGNGNSYAGAKVAAPAFTPAASSAAVGNGQAAAVGGTGYPAVGTGGSGTGGGGGHGDVGRTVVNGGSVSLVAGEGQPASPP